MAAGFKSGGRIKGKPNKKTSELCELIAEKLPDYDPVLSMALLANDESLPLELRIDLHKAVAPYMRARLKMLEITDRGVPMVRIRNFRGDFEPEEDGLLNMDKNGQKVDGVLNIVGNTSIKRTTY